jgi:hypothetical protein
VSATSRARSGAATAEEDREEREDVQSVVKLRTEGTLEMGVTGNGVYAHGLTLYERDLPDMPAPLPQN